MDSHVKADHKPLLQQVFGTFETFEKQAPEERLAVLKDHPTLLSDIVDGDIDDFKKVVSYYPNDELINAIKRDASVLKESDSVRFSILLTPLLVHERWSLLEEIYQDELKEDLMKKRKSGDFTVTLQELLNPWLYLDELYVYILELQSNVDNNVHADGLIQSLLNLKGILSVDLKKKIDKKMPMEKIQFSNTALIARDTIELVKTLSNPKNQAPMQSISNFENRCKGKETAYDKYVGKIVYTAFVFVAASIIGALMGLIIAGPFIPVIFGGAGFFGVLGATLAITGYDKPRGGRMYIDRFRLFKSQTTLAERDVVDSATKVFDPPQVNLI